MSSDSVMYFGKHKGKLVSEVPLEYLKWAYENIKMTGAMGRAIRARVESESKSCPRRKRGSKPKNLPENSKEARRQRGEFVNGMRHGDEADTSAPVECDPSEECPFDA